ncbi:Hsp70 family protein [Nocardia sp. GCM10030253]|uniref:Hsp70 family protein n=1 Tax=Nocardia sp. GCM10030253 TaxID=3273404 RepID=UPI0036448A1B
MNSVSASVSVERSRPSVRSRRSAVTFDSAGGIRIGGIPQFTMAVSDFADLARDPEPVIVGGQIWSPANLVAAVVNGLIDAVEPTAGAVSTYPAVYSDKQVALLRQAMDLSGARDVPLMPEPVAAAEWLEREHGPLQPGFVLVYDLGGTCLDVTVVRVGPDWEEHPMVGKPMRSYDFGGRPLGSMIARYAHGVAPDRSASLSLMSIVDIDGLRIQHIRDSFDVVRACVESTGLTLSDIGRILLVGGAARAAEVARTLAELGRPVVMSADPGQVVATGAAYYAARTLAPAVTGKHFVPHPTVFSSAAVASAIAVSAVTVFGGPVDTGLSPALERLPGIDVPADALLYEPSGDMLLDSLWRSGGVTTRSVAYTPSGLAIAPATRSTRLGPTMAESGPRSRSHQDPRSCCDTAQSRIGTYANPAQFINPLPFFPAPLNLPGVSPVIPRISFPADFPGATPAPAQPDPAPATPDATTTPAAGTDTAATPGTETQSGGATGTPAAGGTTDTPASGGTSGSTSGETSSGGSTSGGGTTDTTSGGGSSGEASSGGSASGGPGGGASSGGSASDGGSSGTSGGTPSGGASSGGASSGGASSGGASSGGASAGGTSSGGASSGGVSGGASSGGTSSGRSSSGGTSSGGASSPGGASLGGASSGGASSGHFGGSGGSGGFGGGAGGSGGFGGGARGR